jgi:hypothetical protein
VKCHGKRSRAAEDPQLCAIMRNPFVKLDFQICYDAPALG